MSDKNLFDGPLLVSENPYEVKLESCQVGKENEKQENTRANVRNDYVLTNHNSNLFSGVFLLQDFKDLLKDFQLHYSTIDRQFYL